MGAGTNLRRGAGFCLAFLFASGALSAEPRWPAGTYSYVVVDQDLRDVLQQFAANTGLSLALSDKVQGRVHGPLPSMPVKQFLDYLAGQFGLEWFFDGSLISVSSASEAQTELIPLHSVAFKTLDDGLLSTGLLDSRYQFRPAMDGHAVLVSGPPRFIAFVKAGIAAIPADKPPPVPPSSVSLPPPAVLKTPAAPRSLTVMRGASSQTVEIK